MTASRSPPSDVKCTWDLLPGKASEKLRVNPRKAWYRNLEEVTDERRLRGDLSPEAAAAGLYRAARVRVVAGLSLPRAAARHAPASDRHRPVQIRRVQAERSRSRWHATRITGRRAGLISTASSIRSSRTVSTAILALYRRQVRHDLALSACTVPLLKDVKSQAPQAICELAPVNVSRNLIINRDAPPFDNPDLRRAMALTLRPQGLYRHPHRGHRATSAASCSRRPKGCGACRRRC